MSKSNLLIELYSNISTTGALTFSSKALVNKLVDQVDLSQAKIVVELGGGDGSITKGIHQRISKDTELYVFEINEAFCESMKKEFQGTNVIVINDSAENLDQYIKSESVDFIFCSLPFTFIPKEISDSILSKSSEFLGSKGKFLAISYSFKLRRIFSRHFKHVSNEFTVRNVPPAFVWSANNH